MNSDDASRLAEKLTAKKAMETQKQLQDEEKMLVEARTRALLPKDVMAEFVLMKELIAGIAEHTSEPNSFQLQSSEQRIVFLDVSISLLPFNNDITGSSPSIHVKQGSNKPIRFIGIHDSKGQIIWRQDATNQTFKTIELVEQLIDNTTF